MTMEEIRKMDTAEISKKITELKDTGEVFRLAVR